MGRLSLLVVAMLWSTTASAIQLTWTNGTSDGQWATAGNWNPAGPPGANDEAFFNHDVSDANCNVASNQTIGFLHSANGYAGAVTIPSGVTLTVSGTSGGLSVIAFGSWNILGTLTFTSANPMVAWNGGTFFIQGTVNVGAPFSIGFVTTSGVGTILASNNVSLGGGATTSGTWSLQMVGADQTLYASTSSPINNLVIGPTSTTALTINPLVAALRVTGDVDVQAGGQLDFTQGGVSLTVGGDLTVASSDGIAPGTAASIIFEGIGASHTVTSNGASLPSVSASGGTTLTFLDDASVRYLSVLTTATLETLANVDLTLVSLTIAGGGIADIDPTSVLHFAGTGWVEDLNINSLGSWVVDGSTDLRSDVVVGDVTINGHLAPRSRVMRVSGDWSVGSAASFDPESGQLVQLAGDGPQAIAIASGGACDFWALYIYTAGTVTVTDGVLVVQSLQVSRPALPQAILDLSSSSARIDTATIGDLGRIDWTGAGTSLTLGGTSAVGVRMFDVAPGGVANFTAPSGTITFGIGSTLRVQLGGSMTLGGGSAGAEISLVANAPALGRWNLIDDSAEGTGFASLLGSGTHRMNPTYVKVRDSYATGTSAPIRPGMSIDLGHNVNWEFADQPPGVPDGGLIFLDGGEGVGDGGSPSLTDPISPYGCSVSAGTHTGAPWALLATLIGLARRRRLKRG